ncbi:MAG TPA: aspartyl protease family protein [Kofleriaceae bacterium]|nr:aspartyl protease family protein [Kofleriaceae bacterium]
MKSMQVFALAALAACAPAARAPSAPAIPAELARFRAVTGGARWDGVAAIASHATLEVGALAGAVDSIEDVRSGRFRNAVELGGFTEGDGFDGAVAWQQGMGGEVTTLETPDEIARARTSQWLTRRGFFRAGGAAYRALGGRALDGKPAHGVAATPAGGAPIELWFDDASGLLVRTVTTQGSDRVVTTLGDYRAVGGVSLAFHSVQDLGDPRSRVTSQTTHAELRPATEAELARPATDEARLHFAPGARAAQVPFDLINNHIYIHAEVDGQPVRFLVDTGGSNVLTPAAAARLGLPAAGKLAVGGTGETKADLAIARGHTLAVGDVQLDRPVFYVINFDDLEDFEGEHIDGLVGFELFHRLAVRIDYPARQLVLMPRAGWAPPAGAIAVPFTMADSTPLAEGAIDGVPARFTIDTGARNSLTVNGPFARAHDLDAKYHPAFEAVTGWGVGGGARGKPVRFHEIKLGAAAVADVAGDLFAGDKGAFANPDIAGNIGGGLLKRFVVTFDYRDGKMYLAPAATPVARDIYNRAGVGFMYAHGEQVLRVVSITPGGAAARAGVAVGDRIVAIDGAPIARQPLWKWRDVLAEGKVGERHTLALEHAGARRDVTLTLLELLP